jgi:hypothetical protein
MRKQANFAINGSKGYPSVKKTHLKLNNLGVVTVVDKTNSASKTIYGSASNYDRISDTVYTASEKISLARKGRRLQGSKSVDHWNADFVCDSTNPTVTGRQNTTYMENTITYTGLPYEISHLWGFTSPIPNVTIYNSAYRVPTMAYDAAFQKMCRDAKMLNLHDQNIFTSIGELKDFKQTVKTVTKHVFKDKRYIADKYLGVNFGIIPFVSDMKNYIENYNNFAPNLKKWNELGKKGKILNRHATVFRKKETNKISIVDSPLFLWPDGLTFYRYECKYKVTSDVVAKTSLYFRAKPLAGDDENALIRSINGISKPFTAAWNLIPFSFLVDWFINVGDQIDTFEYQKPVVNFDILDGCVSLKATQKIICEVTHVDHTTGKRTFLGASERNTKFYYRLPRSALDVAAIINGVGINSPLLLKTDLSGYQWSLAAALAVTNFPRKK